MTERIDLDDLDVQTDDDEPERNRGDWFWSGEGDPDDEPDDPDYDVDLGASSSSDAVPRVPRDNDDRPVGVPVESGGAGGNSAKATNEQQAKAEARYARGEMIDETSDGDSGEGGDPAAGREGDADGDRPTAGSAAHGGSSDPAEMTQAFTFDAIRSLSNLHSALADTQQWADYVGIVGDVDAHVINKFQREQTVDLDFFNGSGTGPRDRLAAIGKNSMFYAERMVVVGLPGEEEYAPEGWEFVPLSEAAEGAGWEIDD